MKENLKMKEELFKLRNELIFKVDNNALLEKKFTEIKGENEYLN